jgi:hypothetical protein
VIITFDWNPINPKEKVKNDVYVVTIMDKRTKNFSYIPSPIQFLGTSVTVEPSDTNARVAWYANYHKGSQINSDVRKAYLNAKSGKGSTVIDTITVAAKFKDGKTATKHIQILFNSKLKCCMKLTD